ncbi:AraC family transcriptional regulator [Roseiarcus fermentans]|uniref:AraC family transcriptional regulator n=1 Tax=Roseiarcus fermentans TaxID=1473586 RepID=A0A366EV23_9HYPH|nr:helix-turn-helix transcriptional regulator [Roseiarcus fermentans]RBP06237.1 AraC family transcriptional regulator [Roseiarcus fermentans]
MLEPHAETFFAEVGRPVVARSAAYPDGHSIRPHRHRRHQLLTSTRGVVVVSAADGAWVAPPQRGMWIPAGITHSVRMVGAVRVNSLYFDPESIAGMPEHCQVVGVSPFMRSLIEEAVRLPREYDVDGREGALMRLVEHEIHQLPHLPLSLPLPAREDLARRCRAFLRRPDVHETIGAWCDALGLNRRSFTRLFRRETGMTFMTWRQQACLVTALPRLAAGETVTSVAMALGYDNPAAFTAMFQRALGVPPRSYFREARAGDDAAGSSGTGAAPATRRHAFPSDPC